MSVLDDDIIEKAENKLDDLENEAKEQGMTLGEYIEHLRRIQILKGVYEKTIASELVSVKPLDAPKAQLFYMDNYGR